MTSRSVATKMADIGVMPHVIEQILNHQIRPQALDRQASTTQQLQHEVRAALALWHDHVRSAGRGRRAQDSRTSRRTLPLDAERGRM